MESDSLSRLAFSAEWFNDGVFELSEKEPDERNRLVMTG